jgi:protein O-mannosyl-transferase
MRRKRKNRPLAIDRTPHEDGVDMSSKPSDRILTLVACGLLLVAVGLTFGQTVGFEFVELDDGACIYENPLVTSQLSWQGIWAVFTGRHLESWAPLTCVSHMLVWHLAGHGPAAHHLTNVLLHGAAAVGLLLVLRQMTGRLWPSAFAAAVFAVHPLRVESVAWATERKDVLSGLLFVLTLAAYVGYARRPFSLLRYLAVLVCFVVGLAAKPMAVTLPFLLLLLDYWPLGRIGFVDGAKGRFAIPARPILDKLPLLAIAGLFCLLTLHGQDPAALDVNQQYPFAWRIGNAMISYAVYLGEFFFPVNLGAAYPRRPLVLPPWQVWTAILTLGVITAAAIAGWRRRPYVLVGWLWYVGMLVPVVGLVQFGAQAEGDRFTYLAQIGLCIALAWTFADAWGGWPRFRPTAAVATALALMVLMAAAWRQAWFWHDTETLWQRAVTCVPDNTIAMNNRAWWLATCPIESKRNGPLAVVYATRVNEIYGGKSPITLDTLAAAYAEAGQFREAVATARKALDLASQQQADWLGELRARLALYEAGKPFRDTSPAGRPGTKP